MEAREFQRRRKRLMDMMGDEGGLEDTLPDVPAASSDGEALCPCPEESEPIIVDFDQLAAAVDLARRVRFSGDHDRAASVDASLDASHIRYHYYERGLHVTAAITPGLCSSRDGYCTTAPGV